MKWLWWGLALFVVATAIKQAFDTLAPPAQAFRAYREEAESRVRRERSREARFRDMDGRVVDVSYRLESAERNEDGSVRLVVVEAVHFQRASESGGLGSRRIAQTRQRVLMTRLDGGWRVSRLEEDETEVTELGAIELEN